MIRSLYTAATGMDAQSLKMDVLSNNLANTSTAGFKLSPGARRGTDRRAGQREARSGAPPGAAFRSGPYSSAMSGANFS